MSNKYQKTKFYIFFSLTVAILAAISHLFVPKDQYLNQSHATDADSVGSDLAAVADFEGQDAEIMGDSAEAYADTTDTTDDTLSATAPESVFVSSKVWSYNECFSDSNNVQLSVAEEIGVRPMTTRAEVTRNVKTHRLVNITTSPYYKIDKLTHSIPYLVPKAQQLINTISINFIDSLLSKGMEPHVPIVTSVLRTGSDIERLQRGNRNSVTNSAHQYGTTVDITYNRFMPLSSDTPTRFDENLKKVLAEVLFDLRDQGQCYVKYERRQACFHLTVR